MTSLRTVINALFPNMSERNLSTVGERVRFRWDGLNDHCITNANYSSGLNCTEFLSPIMTCQSLLSLHWRR